MRGKQLAKLGPILLALSLPAVADSVDEVLEQARAKAAEIEKLKNIINVEPDPNVRLAAFELMTDSGDDVMFEVAVESGLASADRLLQSAAFKAAVMSLERLHLTLAVDKDASEEIQGASQAYLTKEGDQYVLPFDKKDPKAGTISARYFAGEVTGTHLTYTYGKGTGSLFLQDDDAVVGDITLKPGRQTLQFVATGKIR